MKYNKGTKGKTVTKNLAGGKAYIQPKKLELASLVLTSFMKDQFYRTENETLAKLKELIGQVDLQFVAKLAVYARTKYGMRSVSHVLAGEIANRVAGLEWPKFFFSEVVYRPDDMLEILAYYLYSYGKPIPNSLKKGLALATTKFSEYELAKYRGEGKDIKLVDLFNLVHPIPTSEEQAVTFTKLVTGGLKCEETWEAMLSAVGNKAKTEEEKAELKAQVWYDLLSKNKLGYFAALRNICNIIEQSPKSVSLLCELLVNEEKIKKSLVLPFRFITAFNEVNSRITNVPRKVTQALNKAVELSLNNCPVFEGKTLVALDSSGSMAGKPWEIGSLFAAVFAKRNDCDLIRFSDNANYLNVNPDDTVFSIRDSFEFDSGGTDFGCVFRLANKKYDRIIILSDMQAWIGNGTPTQDIRIYKGKYYADPFLYSFDLQGYSTTQFPNNSKLFSLAGFSDKTFDVMKLLEEDKNALITEIEKIEL